MTIRGKLITPFIAGSLLLTLLLTWYTYSSGHKAVENALMLISEAKTNHTVSSINFFFRSILTSMQNMIADPHVASAFSSAPANSNVRTQIEDWINIITQGNEYYQEISILNKKGVCIYSSNPGYIENSYLDKTYVQLALGGRVSFGEPSIGKLTKRLVVDSVGPIDAADGITGALMITNVFPKIVDYDIRTSHDPQTIFVAILSPEGVFLAHKDPSVMGKQSQEFVELYKKLSNVGEQGGIIEYSTMGQTYVGYAKAETTNHWLILTSGVKSEVFASAYKVGLTVLIISLASLSLICFVVIRYANGIISSMIYLIKYAKRVSEGDLDSYLEPTNREDELGTLHNALQILVQTLQNMVKKTQEASRMKGQFLATMSHEIRTPINAILGMTYLSIRDGDMSEKQFGYVKKIQIAAKSLMGLINDILDLSKVEAGMLEIERIPLNLRELLNEVASIHMENFRAKDIDLTLVYEESAPVYFLGDPLRVSQIVNNLISNALKFTKEGSVSITCYQEKNVTENDNIACMVVSVLDTGIGMSEEVIDNLFKPFTQADASITRQFGGTGLGLVISQRLANLLGGGISVNSTPDEGSVFSLSLPFEVNKQGMKQAEELEGDLESAFANLNIQGKRILIAEDNEINQLIMTELISPSGANMSIVTNGQEAVDAVNNEDYDLIFMDMQMPIMDGIQATKIIRTFDKAKNIPIIAVTANAMKEDKQQGFASGMNDYLTKPIDPWRLLHMLDEWLAQEKKF